MSKVYNVSILDYHPIIITACIQITNLYFTEELSGNFNEVAKGIQNLEKLYT